MDRMTGHATSSNCPVTSKMLVDRCLLELHHFGAEPRATGVQVMDPSRISGGTPEVGEGCFTLGYEGGENSYQLRFAVPKPALGNGVGARLRLSGWQDIRYLAIGYTEGNVYRHVKVSNPLEGEWTEICVGHHDLAWGWRNDWSRPEDIRISDIRLYLRGTPSADGARLDVSDMMFWREASDIERNLSLLDPKPISEQLIKHIYSYQGKCFDNFLPQAEAFLAEGRCPLYGDVDLEWPHDRVLPTDLNATGTYKFSWHAQHSAIILMLYARKTGEISPVFAARDLISGWLERSYFSVDPDMKYAWYDHGTAERTLAMLQLWAIGCEYGFDRRFMQRLQTALFRHAQLLSSEVFYASHQPIRYHNHAWFQDLALMAVSLAFPDWPCSSSWIDLAVARLEDQFTKLIVREADYSVFVENSIGYHKGVQRIVSFAGQLTRLSGRDSNIPEVAEELDKFSNFFRYPDPSRSLSQGDTFRLPNPQEPDPRGRTPYGASHVTILPRTGYAIVQADHADRPFMFTMLATALSSTHKHEDDLSFTLYFDGIEWLIDPSFHSHEYAKPIPAYLRSAAAHNALFVPDRSYSIAPGLSRLSGGRTAGGFEIEASHDRYAGIRVERRVEGRLDRLEIEFTETFSEPASARLMLQCGEGVTAQLDGARLMLKHPKSPYQLIVELPSSQSRIRRNETENGEVRGIVGHGFLQISAIDTIEVSLLECLEASWSLRAVSNAES